MRISRTTLGWIAAALVAVAVWLLFAALARPLIVAAYEERSLPMLNGLLSGRSQHGVAYYLSAWTAITWRVAILVGVGLPVLGTALRHQARIEAFVRHWVATVSVPIPVSAGAVVLTAGSLGLVAGAIEILIEGGAHVVRHLPYGEFYWDELWMAPLAMAVLMVLLSIPLVLITRPWRRDAVLGIVPGILMAVAAYAILRSFRGLTPGSALILATGCAVAVSGRIAKSPAAAARLARTGTLVLLTGLVTFAVVLFGARRVGETGRFAALAAPREGMPNIVLLILDTVRAASLSLYGYERETTPNLESFAARGTVFERAWAPAPWTLPSHASMFTGRPSVELSTDYLDRLDGTHPTLAQVLSRYGYNTAGFVSNYYYAGRSTGLARGFVHYDDYRASLKAVLNSCWMPRTVWSRIALRLPYMLLNERRSAEEINQAALDWIDANPERPYFAFLNYLDAHDPYVPPRSYRKRFGNGGRFRLQGERRYTTAELSQLRDHYDSALAYLDAQVGSLLDSLESRGQLQNTIVLIAADHGEAFGEQAPHLVAHGRTLYAPVLHVPLMIVAPGRVPAGVRVAPPVALSNIPATLLSLIGAAPELPGHSLLEHPLPGRAAREPIVSILNPNPRQRFSQRFPVGRGPMQSVVIGGRHFIRNGDGSTELYDILQDPFELHQLELLDQNRWRTLLDSLVSAKRTRVSNVWG